MLVSSVDCLWEGLEEPEIDASEFEDLFAKAPLKKKTSPEKLAKAKKTKEVSSKTKLGISLQAPS